MKLFLTTEALKFNISIEVTSDAQTANLDIIISTFLESKSLSLKKPFVKKKKKILRDVGGNSVNTQLTRPRCFKCGCPTFIVVLLGGRPSLGKVLLTDREPGTSGSRTSLFAPCVVPPTAEISTPRKACRNKAEPCCTTRSCCRVHAQSDTFGVVEPEARLKAEPSPAERRG